MESLLCLEMKADEKICPGRIDVTRMFVRIFHLKRIRKRSLDDKEIKRKLIIFSFGLILIHIIVFLVGGSLIYVQWETFKDYKLIYWGFVIVGCLLASWNYFSKVLCAVYQAMYEKYPDFRIVFYKDTYETIYGDEKIQAPNVCIIETASDFLIWGAGIIRKKDLDAETIDKIHCLIGGRTE